VSANKLLRTEAQSRAGIVSDASYQVQLDFTQGDQTFGCETTISFKATPGSATFLDYTAPSVDSIKLNGESVDPAAFDGNRIAVGGLADRNTMSIHGKSAYMNTGVGLHRFVDPVDNAVYLHTQFEPFDAHRVFPCFDQPDIKGAFDLFVTAPAGWQVIANTPLAEWKAVGPQSPAGQGGLWRFHPTKPISTYLAAIIAGPFEAIRDKHRDIDLGLMCRKSLLQYLEPDAEEIFTITKQGFDFFEEAFGYPYAFGKYDQLFVPEFNHGAMENIGAVTFNEGAIFRSRVTEARRERRGLIILHEMAHMWFGDLVTMRWWNDLWLNESFATYQGTLALVEATRFKQAWTTFAQGEKASAYAQDQLPTTHPITADIPDTEATLSNFDAITYSKGASVLKQLVAWVGRDAFDQGVKKYFRKHEYGNTELGDFLAPLEEASGRDLKAWSGEWLEKAGVNTLSASFETESDHFTLFSIVQHAPGQWPTLRPHRLAIGLYDDEAGRLVRRRRVETDVVGAKTEIAELIGETVPALIILNDDDLAYAKVRLDPLSLKTTVARVGDIEDPLARALCWSAAWQMVRDAEMAGRDYLSMVLGNIGSETDIGIVQTLLAQAKRAITAYGDPTNRSNAVGALATHAKDALEKAVPGGDLQRTWAETFIGAATGADGARTLRGLLDGSVFFDGLAVDIGLRWQIVGTLAEGGAGTQELINDELKRDPTDDGKRQAMAATASRPLEGAKADAWQMFVEDEGLPLATLRAVAAGFQRYDQTELIEPFVERYFSEIGRIWEVREPEVARTFAASMFPRVLVNEDLVRRTDEYMNSNALAYPLKRILLEAKDELERSLRARSRDAASG